MKTLILLAVCLIPTTSNAVGYPEFAEWRRRVGLPVPPENKELTRFAQMKAEYRAVRVLPNGHAGPKGPPGTREGTADASPMWGWLTCCQEEDIVEVGCGMCVARNGKRYMVLICKGGSGRALIPRQNIPTYDTSHLTPNPPRR